MKTERDYPGRGALISLVVLAICTLIGLLFREMNFDSINTILVYITGVVLIAMWTQGRIYSMLASLFAVGLFNFFFTKPYFSLVAEADYFATFTVMLIVSSLISSLTDTIRKNSKEAARNEERIKQEELRSNLLRSISHDLRTPLTGISGNATMLLRYGDKLDPTIQREILQSIDEDSKWLINLVENLLSITRLSGQLNVRMQIGVLQEVTDEALQHIDSEATKYIIKRDYDGEAVLARIDAKLMTQVIVNLVNNAIKHNPIGTEITVSVHCSNGMAEIRVADNGVGISDINKDRIFERFYSVEKFTNDSRRGLGLGLHLCKSIMEAHDGSIRVEDNEPSGAVFICTMPLTDIEDAIRNQGDM